MLETNNSGRQDCQRPIVTGNASGSCQGVQGWLRISGLDNISNHQPVQVILSFDPRFIINDVLTHSLGAIEVEATVTKTARDTYSFSHDYHQAWRSADPAVIGVRVAKYNRDGSYSGNFHYLNGVSLPSWDNDCTSPGVLPMSGQASYECAVGITGSVTITGIGRLLGQRPIPLPIPVIHHGQSVVNPIIITYSTDSRSTADDIVEVISLNQAVNDTVSFSRNYHDSWKTDQPINVAISSSSYDTNGDMIANRDRVIATITLPAWDADGDGVQDCRDSYSLEPDGEVLYSCQGVRGWVRIEELSSISNHQPVKIILSSDPNSTADDITVIATYSAVDTFNFNHGYDQAWQSDQPIDIEVLVVNYNQDGSHSDSFHSLDTVTLPAWDSDQDGVADCQNPEELPKTAVNSSSFNPIGLIGAVSGGTALKLVHGRRRRSILRR